MPDDQSEPQRRYDGPSLEEMGVRPEDCGIGHPHIDARVLDMARLIVQTIEEDPTRFHIADENLGRDRKRRGTLTQARQAETNAARNPRHPPRRFLRRPAPAAPAKLAPLQRSHQRRRALRNQRPASAPRGNTGLEAAAAPTGHPRTAARRQSATAMTPDRPSTPGTGLVPLAVPARASPQTEAQTIAAAEIDPQWRAELEAAGARPLELRLKYAFVRTYKPKVDDAKSRALNTTGFTPPAPAGSNQSIDPIYFLITHNAHVRKSRSLSAEGWRPIRRAVPFFSRFRSLVMAQRVVVHDEGRTG